MGHRGRLPDRPGGPRLPAIDAQESRHRQEDFAPTSCGTPAPPRLNARVEQVDIQALLGHESINTTPIDIHVEPKRMERVVGWLWVEGRGHMSKRARPAPCVCPRTCMGGNSAVYSIPCGPIAYWFTNTLSKYASIKPTGRGCVVPQLVNASLTSRRLNFAPGGWVSGTV